MQEWQVFPLYAAISVLYFIPLNANVIINRRREKIAVGEGGNENLMRARSMYGNFFEFNTFFLLLLLAAEMTHVSSIALHVMAVLFYVARLIHIYSIKTKQGKFRVIAIATSQTMMVFTAMAIAYQLLFQ